MEGINFSYQQPSHSYLSCMYLYIYIFKQPLQMHHCTRKENNTHSLFFLLAFHREGRTAHQAGDGALLTEEYFIETGKSEELYIHIYIYIYIYIYDSSSYAYIICTSKKLIPVCRTLHASLTVFLKKILQNLRDVTRSTTDRIFSYLNGRCAIGVHRAPYLIPLTFPLALSFRCVQIIIFPQIVNLLLQASGLAITDKDGEQPFPNVSVLGHLILYSSCKITSSLLLLSIYLDSDDVSSRYFKTKRYPLVYLHLHLPTDEYDVNVTPDKVRYQIQRLPFSLFQVQLLKVTKINTFKN